jgi:hypothetical protein
MTNVILKGQSDTDFIIDYKNDKGFLGVTGGLLILAEK